MHCTKALRIPLPTGLLRAAVFAVLAFGAALVRAQIPSTRIASISPQDALSETPLTIRVELRQGETIERVLFVHRPFAESEWTQIEMDLRGNLATARLPATALRTPFLEYYIVMIDRSGRVESHPLSESSDPLARPPSRAFQLPVIDKNEDQQVVFLSPEFDATFSAEDVLISVSLLRADSIVVKRATLLYLDGSDITKYAVRSDDLLVYVPDNHGVRLKPGKHKVTVSLFNRLGNLHRQVTTYFNVLDEASGPLQLAADRFLYSGSFDLESRREKVNGRTTWYNRGGTRFSGRYEEWRFNGNLYITSEESASRQPQNRYYAAIESPWLLLGYGDSYPLFPQLILNGKRLRGLNSSLRLGKFNLDLALGKTVRGVEGTLIKTIPAANLEAEQRADQFAAYARIDTATWGKYSYGSYARSMFALRPSFGSGERYQIGFTWLKSKDDLSSIRFGTRPQENLVLGTDLVSKFDEGRIELAAQAAFSAYNSDISSGTFTDAYIDTVYKKDAAAIKDARDILSKFITVNDNLRPLSFKKLSTMAYDASLSLNYFDNAFKASYLFRGSDYTSFGQTFLRNDIAGFSLFDRMRLFGNECIITIAFERMHDNTSESKAATTRFTTFSLAASYDPRNEMPSITVGYTHYANRNGLVSPIFDSTSTVHDQTNRIFFLGQHRFQYLAVHNVTASISTSLRDDYTVRNLDVRNMAVSFTLNTKFDIPLQTTLGYTSNVNRFPASVIGKTTELNYATLLLAGTYIVAEGRGTFGAALSPTLGDFRRFALDLSGQWSLTPLMSVLLQYSLFANQGARNDDFWSLKYRYEL